MKNYSISTKILHSDRHRNPQYGSLHEPIHTSVAYGYDDSKELADVFQGKRKGFAYSRQSSPTVKALEDKITLMEDGIDTVTFSTGMSAITHTLLSLLRKGDHIISSQFLFGNTRSVFDTLIQYGIEIDYVDPCNISDIESLLKENTKLIFSETIANPVTQIAALEDIGDFCEINNLIFIVDNTMTSPVIFQPKNVKATFVIHSLTKYICGHGNALGGSVTDTGCFNWSKFENIYENYKKQDPSYWGITQIRKKGLRDFGGALSADNAHRISIGAETLTLRMEKISSNALSLANFLNEHSKIKKVNYPGLENHPQYFRAKKLFKNSSGLMSFELSENIDVFEFLNKLKIVISSSNLGDNRTLAIPVAHTIFFEIGSEKRKEMGVSDSLIRISVGIESQKDLIHDFKQALELI